MRSQGKTEAQFLRIAVFLALVGVLLAGCLPREDRREIDLDDRASDAELRELTARADSDVLRFGFDLRASPQEDACQYLPFLEYLTKATGYTFELRFTPQDGQIVDDLGMGVVQFVAMGASSTIQAHAEYGVIPLVRGLNAQGQAESGNGGSYQRGGRDYPGGGRQRAHAAGVGGQPGTAELPDAGGGGWPGGAGDSGKTDFGSLKF